MSRSKSRLTPRGVPAGQGIAAGDENGFLSHVDGVCGRDKVHLKLEGLDGGMWRLAIPYRKDEQPDR